MAIIATKYPATAAHPLMGNRAVIPNLHSANARDCSFDFASVNASLPIHALVWNAWRKRLATVRQSFEGRNVIETKA